MSQNFTFESLKSKLNSIKNRWHLGTHQGNDGNPGNTLESLLGIPENNIRLPDFGVIEIKCQRIETSSLITLFHKEPLPPASLPKLIKSLGWKHQKAGTKYDSSEMSFRSTTGCDSYTSRGFRIMFQDNKILFTYDKTKVKRNDADRSRAFPDLGEWSDDIETRVPHYSSLLPVYWEEGDFIKSCINKFDKTLTCFCEKKTENEKDYFKYVEAIFLSGFLPESIRQTFASGGMYIDIDARTGKNHGVKLRIKPDLLPSLFSKSERVF